MLLMKILKRVVLPLIAGLIGGFLGGAYYFSQDVGYSLSGLKEYWAFQKAAKDPALQGVVAAVRKSDGSRRMLCYANGVLQPCLRPYSWLNSVTDGFSRYDREVYLDATPDVQKWFLSGLT